MPLHRPRPRFIRRQPFAVQHARVSSAGRTTGPLTPSPDAKHSASKLERKGQPKILKQNQCKSSKTKFNKTRSHCLGGNGSWKQNQDNLLARIATVPHEAGGMVMVECPTESFREHIRKIHDSRKVNQNDVLHESPMLKCKMSDFHMMRAISGSTVVDDLDRRIVVFACGSGLSLSAPQLVKNESQTFGDFGGGIGCCEFSFHGTLRTD